MRLADGLKFSLRAIFSHRLRSFLTMLGIAVGVGAVILLTSLGEGVRQLMLTEFSQFGTNLIAVTPGKTATMGISGAVINTVRPLSIEDQEALQRLPQLEATVPVVQGNGVIEAGRRQRRTNILGVGPAAPQVWRFRVAIGNFLPPDEARAARSLVVLGSKVRDELFGQANPLGEIVRLGGFRYRVIGVMAAKGQILGFDLDDAIYIPAARALELFNRESLMEIDILYSATASAPRIVEQLKKMLIDRHGSEDFTITTQNQMLEVLDGIFARLTQAIAALGAISLLVGAVGILTIMTIAVHDRTGEIGLLRALGASRRQILLLFLAEAVVLSFLGGAAGLVMGWSGAKLIHLLVPFLPTRTSGLYVGLSLLVAGIIGLAAGVIPAGRAANLDPQQALRNE